MDSRRTSPDPAGASLASFHPIIARWFRDSIGKPTDVQTASWPALCSGEHALIAAPTGSGKTLAAFLASIDSLFRQALSNDLADHTQILYVSPLKALSNDVQKNLRRPLGEMSGNALAAGLLIPEIRIEVRTGDTQTSRPFPGGRTWERILSPFASIRSTARLET